MHTFASRIDNHSMSERTPTQYIPSTIITPDKDGGSVSTAAKGASVGKLHQEIHEQATVKRSRFSYFPGTKATIRGHRAIAILAYSKTNVEALCATGMTPSELSPRFVRWMHGMRTPYLRSENSTSVAIEMKKGPVFPGSNVAGMMVNTSSSEGFFNMNPRGVDTSWVGTIGEPSYVRPCTSEQSERAV